MTPFKVFPGYSRMKRSILIQNSKSDLFVDGPGTDGEVDIYIGQTVISQGRPHLIGYFSRVPEAARLFYAYIPEYMECAVTRALPDQGYAPEVNVL